LGNRREGPKGERIALAYPAEAVAGKQHKREIGGEPNLQLGYLPKNYLERKHLEKQENYVIY